MDRISGVVFYEGKSLIDGKPIVGIATFNTDNAKTGNLVQTWILLRDEHPLDAINTGADSSICGDCPLRGLIRPASERTKPNASPLPTTNKGRSCYVLVHTAPTQVWKSYKKGNYPKLCDEHANHMLGKGLRYGSYGDPVAIPMKAWKELSKHCTGRAEPGYTHQWKKNKFKSWRTHIMASTHTVADNAVASAAGWRTFRTVADVSDIQSNEIICPASAEGGDKATCATCGACNGRHSMEDMRKSIIIVAHGHGKVGLVKEVIAGI